MKRLFLLGLLALPFFSHSQNFKSALFADHPGVYAVGNMPSLLVDRSSKWDIQVVGTQFNLFNSDNEGRSFYEKMKSAMLTSNPRYLLSLDANFVMAEARVVLPTISYAINKNNAVAFSAGIRSISYERTSGLNFSEFIQSIRDGENFNGRFFDDFMTMYSNSWMQFGLSYARNWEVSDDWSVQTGLTLRYLSGIASGKFEIDGLNSDFRNSETDNISAKVSIVYNDELNQMMESETFEADLFSKNGYSVDFSFSAQWKDRLTIGLSFLDLGKINYKSAKNSTDYALNGETLDGKSLQQIQSVDQLTDSLSAQFSVDDIPIDRFSTRTPFRAILFAKYKLYNHLSLSVSNVLLKPRESNRSTGDTVWSIHVAPTYEIRKVAVIIPMGYSTYSDFHTGFGLQWRFLNLGSDNILSYYFSDDPSRAMSIYLSFRVKIGQYDKKK
ncbi:MAG: DUF5723 family protein [Reichenbachiella sp.]|uniref:DUF5723 family protein n=1 Tax=Reichenbachiella sp. TaxID=2184521 RepID=UPI00296677FE|nr:DUF5723 family protein [Reichenbachiella sp.]MDW3208308.1 DUF5723 family protein [Reichenbachiella sp.]